MDLISGEADVKRLQPACLALMMAGCIVAVKSNNPPPDSGPPPRHDPPPQQQYQGPDARLQLKYDASLDDCFAASRKALAFMKFTESDSGKKTGEITAHWGKVFVHCTMYRLRHHTYLTFYFRVNDPRADARMPGDFAAKCHAFVAKEVKEEGRKTD